MNGISLLRHTILALVRRDGPDLTARQLSVFLTCYLEDEAQTVRGLAIYLNVAKPTISRALDRRSVLVQRTVTGAEFLRDLDEMLADAGREADRAPSQAGR